MSLPAWLAQLGPTETVAGAGPQLGLCPADEGFRLVEPLQDWWDLEEVLGQAGVWFFPAACMQMALNMLQAGRQRTGSGQPRTGRQR